MPVIICNIASYLTKQLFSSEITCEDWHRKKGGNEDHIEVDFEDNSLPVSEFPTQVASLYRKTECSVATGTVIPLITRNTQEQRIIQWS